MSEAPVLGDLGVDPLIDMGLGPVVGPPELLLRGPPGLLVLRPLEEVKEGPRLKKTGHTGLQNNCGPKLSTLYLLAFLAGKKKNRLKNKKLQWSFVNCCGSDK